MRVLKLPPAGILMLGQVVGLGGSFFIPMLLARQLTVEDFGTYRLVMMMQLLLTILGSIGFDGGLFRHVRRESEPPAFQGALSFLWGGGCGLVIAIGVWIFGEEIGRLLAAPELAVNAKYLAIMIFLAMPTAHVEHLCVAVDRPVWSALIVAGHALGCALGTAIAVLVYGSLAAILIGLMVWFSLRFVAVASVYVFQLRRTHIPLVRWHEQWLHHLRFGFPIGGNNFLLALGRLDRFLVSGMFGVQSFARYSVGCFEIPMARPYIDAAQNLAAVGAVDRHQKSGFADAMQVWGRDCLRIALLLAPVVLLCMFFAEPLLALVFGQTYASSAPIFQIFVLGLWASSFDPELFLRATDKAYVSIYANLAMTAVFALIVAACYFAHVLTLEGLVALRVANDIACMGVKYGFLALTVHPKTETKRVLFSRKFLFPAKG